MSKEPDFPESEKRPSGWHISGSIPSDTGEDTPDSDKDTPDDWDDAGECAARFGEDERPRREQMNLDIADEVKREFKKRIRDSDAQMRFVVEDLLRLYLSKTDSSS